MKCSNVKPTPGVLQRAIFSILELGLGLILGTVFAPAAHANDLHIGKPAPPLKLHTLDGRTISTAELGGKVVIVTFWATFCEPCRTELPLLSAYAKKHEAQGLQVLGFSLDRPDAINEVKSLADTLQLSFPVGILGDPHLGGYGRIWRIPVSFVIDRKGNLASNGWEDKNPAWTHESLTRIVDPLLELKN